MQLFAVFLLKIVLFAGFIAIINGQTQYGNPAKCKES